VGRTIVGVVPGSYHSDVKDLPALWTRLATACGVLVAAVALLVAATARDVETAAIGLGFAVGAAVMHRGHRLLGSLVLALLSANLLVWLVPATYSNVAHGDEILAVALPMLMVGLALSMLGAIGGLLIDAPPRAAAAVPMATGALVVGVVVVPALLGVGESHAVEDGDLRVSTRSMAFSTDELHAASGEISVVVTNHDLFWHTLTIDDLDVDLRVPVRATRRLTFEAAPGTYDFVCAIPGHEGAGMRGTLVIR
jgi:plastocyanin